MKTWSDEELRVKVAELLKIGLGHHWSRGTCETCFVSVSEPHTDLCPDVIYPNYPCDLNAMREAEETLKMPFTVLYIQLLENILRAEWEKSQHGMTWLLIHASARDRALAFVACHEK